MTSYQESKGRSYRQSEFAQGRAVTEIGRKMAANWASTPLKDVTCSQCGTIFKAKTKRAKFCTNACRLRDSYRSEVAQMRACGSCGKDFPVNSRRPTAKHCDYICAGRGRPRIAF